MKINSVIIATALLSPLAMAAPHSASGIILTYDLDGNEKLSLEEFVDAADNVSPLPTPTIMVRWKKMSMCTSGKGK